MINLTKVVFGEITERNDRYDIRQSIWKRCFYS